MTDCVAKTETGVNKFGSPLVAYEPVPVKVAVAEVVGLITTVGLLSVIGVRLYMQGVLEVNNKQLSAILKGFIVISRTLVNGLGGV